MRLHFRDDPRRWMLDRVRRIYNQVHRCFIRDELLGDAGLRELNEISARSQKPSDMADHLVQLFAEALAVRPRFIVELGIRGGESSFVFERVARLTGCTWVSVDIDDCSRISSYPGWIFVQADDIYFASEFERWCLARDLRSQIDVLFIDTSHEYEHTVREIACYFPFLSPRAKVIFHDTNLREIYFRRNGRMELGRDNARGVIRALEQYIGQPFHERRAFVAYAGGFLIRHYPYSAGLTVLERVELLGKPGLV